MTPDDRELAEEFMPAPEARRLYQAFHGISDEQMPSDMALHCSPGVKRLQAEYLKLSQEYTAELAAKAVPDEQLRDNLLVLSLSEELKEEETQTCVQAIEAIATITAQAEALRRENERLRVALQHLHDSYVKVCPYANLVAQEARAALAQSGGE